MPKTTKRTATKRAARIARAHATDLPKLEVKESQSRQSLPGYKAPARGIARYHWATVLVLGLILLSGYLLYANHVGPFALPKAKPTPVGLTAKQTATAQAKSVQATTTALAGPAQVTATPLAAGIPAAEQKAIAASPCLNASVLSQITNTAAAPSAADMAKITRTYNQAPPMSIDTKKVYCAGFNTTRGLIVVELRPAWAPATVNNFVFLAQHKFYDGLTFHRVIQTGNGLHIIQGGDPQGNGQGGPGYKFDDEPVKSDYTAGTIAMANSGANTNGSQFFINTGDNSKGLGKQYNLFGQVVKGLDVTLMIQGPGDDASTKNIKPDVMNHVLVVAAP
jgi:cyclophilin family peptidyl-prolyl cis-trans isomerase